MKKIEDWTGKKFTVAVGTDHGGFELKTKLVEYLQAKGIECKDMGPFAYDAADDYSDYAAKVGKAVSVGEVECGILLCT